MDIAIIGISIRMPEADTLLQFQQHLAKGRDSVREISARRKKNSGLSTKEDYQLLGYLEDIDLFDYAFFGISRSEAINMAPQQRILMEIAYETFENAGYNYEAFNNSRTGIYIGDTQLQYYQIAREIVPTLFTGNMSSLMAGRIARFFNLRQKAMMIDTTCSSSLVALHQACKDIESGECDHALVGAVSLNLFPGKKSSADHMGIQSPGGKARTFSAQADGTSAGEAGACILLKPLEKALADNDLVHAVIKGSAVNQDANLSGSLTAPSSTAQSEVIREAWKQAGIDPLKVSYIEAHGTGTRLGDPIEVEGIDLAFRPFTDKRNFCAVSAVKSNIGHTDCVAGLAGLVKAVLSLKQQQLYPSLHFTTPNPFIDFKNSAVYVNDRLRPWEADGGRIAGVSSFGLTGTNCHVVLTEAPARKKTDELQEHKNAYPILLSGHTLSSLKKNTSALLHYLEAQPGLSLEDVSYTLSAGRKHYRYRRVIWAASLEELKSTLRTSSDIPQAETSQAAYEKKVWVFSDWTSVDQALIAAYCRHTVFREQYEQCITLSGNNSRLYVCQAAFQYSLYKLLAHAGIRMDVMAGGSFGKKVIDVITGSLSLETLLQMALTLEPAEEQVNEERIRLLLDKFGTRNVLFLEMGPLGQITSQIAALPDGGYTVTSLAQANENSVLSTLSALFTHHVDVNMTRLWPGNEGKRVELFTYQFDRVRCWLGEEPVPDNIKEWSHTFKWVEEALPSGPAAAGTAAVLLVAPVNDALSAAVAAQLGTMNSPCYRLQLSDRFSQVNDRCYEVNIRNQADYITAFNNWKNDGAKITRIIFLSRQHNPDELLDNKLQDVYAQFFALHASREIFSARDCMLTVVTQNAVQILPAERVDPTQGMYAAMLKGIQAEYPSLAIQSIDLENAATENAPHIIAEYLTDNKNIRHCAYRGAKRYVPRLCPVATEKPQYAEFEWFPEEGTYVVTGGATGIGNLISTSILKKQQSNFIILGRTELPDKRHWKGILAGNKAVPDVYERIKALTKLEAQGAGVEYYAVDISDQAALKAITDHILKRYESIDGILHAAGVGVEQRPFEQQTLPLFKATLAAKVQGTVWLDEALQVLEPRFFVLFSSLNALVPKKHSTAYAVANAFEDSYAIYRNRQGGTRYLSVNWPGWDFDESIIQEDNGELSKELRPVKPREGVAAFYHVLPLDSANIVIVPFDLAVFAVNPYFQTEKKLLEQPKLVAITDNLTSMERKMLKIWQEVLKSDNIGVEDDFFEAGGHSLIGMQIVNRIEKEIGIAIDFEIIYDYSTIKTLCAYLEEQAPDTKDAEPASDPLYKISAGGQDYYEITRHQVYWVNESADKLYKDLDKSHGLVSRIMEITGTLDVAALQQAVSLLIERHESLRSTFHFIEGAYRLKVIAPEDYPVFPVYRNAGHPDTANDSARNDFVYFRDHGFNLEQGPLFLVRLLQLENNKYIISIRLHHVIADGWSVEILIRDLFTAYKAYKHGAAPLLPPLEQQFRHYLSLSLHNAAQNREAHRRYWSQVCPVFPEELIIPAESKPGQHDFSKKISRTEHFSISGVLYKQLGALASYFSTSLFVILQAGFKSYLNFRTGQTDMLISTDVHGRDNQGIENQIGSYARTVVIRTVFDPADSFEDQVRKVKQANKDMLEYNAFSLMDWLYEIVPPEKDLTKPVWKVSMQYSDHTGFDADMPLEEDVRQEFDVRLLAEPSKQNNLIPIDMQLNFAALADRISAWVDYDSSLYTPQDVRQLMDDYISYMQQLDKVRSHTVSDETEYTSSPL